jgi:hypothetical protein
MAFGKYTKVFNSISKISYVRNSRNSSLDTAVQENTTGVAQ